MTKNQKSVGRQILASIGCVLAVCIAGGVLSDDPVQRAYYFGVAVGAVGFPIVVVVFATIEEARNQLGRKKQ